MKKLLWMDLEMTGLDVNKEVVIECAVVVTDLALNSLDSYEAIVNQPRTYLDAMDDWNKEHHTKSGLIQKIPFGKTPEQVEEDLLKLMKKHWPKIEKKDDKPVLAGNSIAQDKLFLEKYFKQVAGQLHYRVLDVTSWKIVFNNIYNLKYEKKNAHRAVEDILESIEELKFYMKYIKN